MKRITLINYNAGTVLESVNTKSDMLDCIRAHVKKGVELINLRVCENYAPYAVVSALRFIEKGFSDDQADQDNMEERNKKN